MNIVEEKWQEIIEHLRIEHELSNVSFNTWIKPLRVYKVVDNTVFILVNVNASVEYIDKKYRLPLTVSIAEITEKEYEVVFISEDDEQLEEIVLGKLWRWPPKLLKKRKQNQLHKRQV